MVIEKVRRKLRNLQLIPDPLKKFIIQSNSKLIPVSILAAICIYFGHLVLLQSKKNVMGTIVFLILKLAQRVALTRKRYQGHNLSDKVTLVAYGATNIVYLELEQIKITH